VSDDGFSLRDNESNQEEEMKKTSLIVFAMALVFGGAARSGAQVKRVQMHIAGYLCGN
jgi:hypothetical protein